jgi:hypothetical protein
LVLQGETYDWEGQFGSLNNEVDIYQEDYDSDEEDCKLYDQLLRDIGVDQTFPDSGQDAFSEGMSHCTNHSIIQVCILGHTSSVVPRFVKYASMKKSVKFNRQSTFSLPTLLDCAYGLTLLFQTQA